MKSHQQITEQQAYDIWIESFNSTFQTVLSIVLYVLIRRGWHREALVKLFNDVIDAVNTPIEVFGKEVDDLYIQEYISKNYPEIDFSKAKFNLAPLTTTRRRNKEHSNHITQQSKFNTYER